MDSVTPHLASKPCPGPYKARPKEDSRPKTQRTDPQCLEAAHCPAARMHRRGAADTSDQRAHTRGTGQAQRQRSTPMRPRMGT